MDSRQSLIDAVSGGISNTLVTINAITENPFLLDLNISFEPSPDYPGIATAAGNAWGATVTQQSEVDSAIREGTRIVQGGKCAVIEVA
jgi:hypothetical protein